MSHMLWLLPGRLLQSGLPFKIRYTQTYLACDKDKKHEVVQTEICFEDSRNENSLPAEMHEEDLKLERGQKWEHPKIGRDWRGRLGFL